MNVALVTGGASGIGAACVARLQHEGRRVAVIDRADEATGDLYLRADVTDEVAVAEAIATVAESFGRIDLAILAAGVGGFGLLSQMSLEEWDRVMNVNLRGTFVCLRECATSMIAAGSGGSIIAISSVSSTTADTGMAHYCASKAGVNALVRVASREFGPHGISVNAVGPGTTDTPMFAVTESNPAFRERVARRAAFARIGTADDIANAVLAVASAPWITGQLVLADGGLTGFSPLDPVNPG